MRWCARPAPRCEQAGACTHRAATQRRTAQQLKCRRAPDAGRVNCTSARTTPDPWRTGAAMPDTPSIDGLPARLANGVADWLRICFVLSWVVAACVPFRPGAGSACLRFRARAGQGTPPRRTAQAAQTWPSSPQRRDCATARMHTVWPRRIAARGAACQPDRWGRRPRRRRQIPVLGGPCRRGSPTGDANPMRPHWLTMPSGDEKTLMDEQSP
jgi:hypothetical protein